MTSTKNSAVGGGICRLCRRDPELHTLVYLLLALLIFYTLKLVVYRLPGNHPSDSDGMYAINGYKLITADRDIFGGGVATYIPHSCQHETITIPMTNAECIWIRITTGQASLVVGTIYCPQRSDPAEFVMQLERAIKLVERPQDEILLRGDFNAKNCLWHSSDTTDALGEDLHWLCETHGLTQHVSFATHLRQHTPTSCLVLAISIFSRSNITITSLPPMSASDHIIIQGNL